MGGFLRGLRLTSFLSSFLHGVWFLTHAFEYTLIIREIGVTPFPLGVGGEVMISRKQEFSETCTEG